MKNLAKLLLGTMLVSALFVGCGNKDEATDASETVEATKADKADDSAKDAEKVASAVEEIVCRQSSAITVCCRAAFFIG